MKRGTHPNSLANLKKGKATQFGPRGDPVADAARANSHKSATERMCIGDAMVSIMDDKRRREIAEKIVQNMDKSPEWCKLALRMLGELPPEQTELTHKGGDVEIVIGGEPDAAED